jgi:NADPH2:quinone reductase
MAARFAQQEKEKTMSSAMMRAMRAESFTGYAGLKLVEAPRPRKADGRALVRITAAGVTPLDHTILSGTFPHHLKAPLVLGNEGAGVVEEGGTDFPIGSRVMFFGAYGAFEDGTYSEKLFQKAIMRQFSSYPHSQTPG